MQATLERLRERREQRGDEGGFTLIELLIVIVILGILAAIVVFAVQNLTSSSAQSSCKSDFKTVETAVEAYKAQMGNYPSGSTGTKGAAPNTDTSAGDATYAALAAPTGVNAASAGVILLTASGAGTNNTVTPAVGPWLKDVPGNTNHYGIFVPNDGTGTIVVTGADGKVIGTSVSNCSSVS